MQDCRPTHFLISFHAWQMYMFFERSDVLLCLTKTHADTLNHAHNQITLWKWKNRHDLCKYVWHPMQIGPTFRWRLLVMHVCFCPCTEKLFCLTRPCWFFLAHRTKSTVLCCLHEGHTRLLLFGTWGVIIPNKSVCNRPDRAACIYQQFITSELELLFSRGMPVKAEMSPFTESLETCKHFSGLLFCRSQPTGSPSFLVSLWEIINRSRSSKG